MVPRVLSVLIADDEPAARDRLRHFLEKEPDIAIVAECADGISALSAIDEHSPDLVFLDIRMPELNGFEIIRKLRPASVPPIIFVSAHHEHALEAFNFCAVDYLLKPFDRERFRKALTLGREMVLRREADARKQQIATIADEVQGNHMDRFAIRSSGKITMMIFSEIIWIEGAGNYVEVHVGEKVHLLRRTLAALEKSLPPEFVRISKSHIVNMNWIRELKPKSHGDCFVTLQNGTKLISTRNYRAALRNRLGV